MATIALILLVTIFCEFIDSFLGMMYGTILSPVLIISGYDPKLVVPAILISQAIGGAIASYRHYKLNNSLIFKKNSKDFRITLLISSLGVIATLIGAYIGASVIPKVWLKNYIGILCLIIGGSVLLKVSFSFSWGKMILLSLIGAFNKAVSGGGFGPLMSSGQIIVGRESKSSIIVTDFAEVPICLASFAVWVWMNKWPDTPLIYILPIGAAIGGYLGPIALKISRSKEKITKIVGFLVFILGVATVFFGVKG